MDAAALLKSQGWRGLGHSLHHSDDSIGLKRPLLFHKKSQSNIGIGTTHHTSNMWWMNAFDQQLKGLETINNGQGVVQTLKSSAISKIQKKQSKYGEITSGQSLYAGFVRGGLLEGTIEDERDRVGPKVSCLIDVERQNPQLDEFVNVKPKKSGDDESKEERRQRKEAKRLRRAARAVRRAEKNSKKTIESLPKVSVLETPPASLDVSTNLCKETCETYTETREERRNRKLEKKIRKEKSKLRVTTNTN